VRFLNAVVAWSLRNRAVVVLAAVLLVIVGVRAAIDLPIDAVPDVTNVQVQVITPAPALSPTDSPAACSRFGSMTTWYCLSSPPKLFTSTTPGTARSCGLMYQSSVSSSSISEWRWPFTTNW
jgi:hypothetical protein